MLLKLKMKLYIHLIKYNDKMYKRTGILKYSDRKLDYMKEYAILREKYEMSRKGYALNV
jgi:hypothetical protein